jgi:acyl-ACP thioesterase
MYTFDTTVSYSRLDKNGTVPYYEIMNYLQDCSTFESEKLGVGVEHMKEVHKAWVVLAYKIQFHKPLKLGDEICVGTAPSSFDRVMGNRQYFIKDKQGNYLVKAETIWALIELDKRMPVRIQQEDVKMYQTETAFDDINVSRKVRLFGEKKKLPEFKVARSYIDGNGHMNNANYLRAAEEYLPEQKEYRELEILYSKEALEGETIIPYLYEEENGIGIRFESKTGELHTLIKLTL